MDVDGANETDVREDIAVPFLAHLGYKRRSENDILREFSLSYDRNFLGRKKNNDPPLRGRADYVLSVRGVARWVLEIKAPSEEISQDVIDQAISYARHPEVSGHYAVILNGKRLVIFRNTQRSDEPPFHEAEVSSPIKLAEDLKGLLSPQAIRRDCGPPVVDLGRPLANGFRSRAQITGGSTSVTNAWFETNQAVPNEVAAGLNEACRRLKGLRSAVDSGEIWRDENSQIRAMVAWNLPHEHWQKFAEKKDLSRMEYISLDEAISCDPTCPTAFDVCGQIEVKEGEVLFDLLKWRIQNAEIEMSMIYRGQAAGYLERNIFRGLHRMEMVTSFPELPDFIVALFTTGEFEIVVDDR